MDTAPIPMDRLRLIGNIASANGVTKVHSGWVKRSAPYAGVLFGKQTSSQHGITIAAWQDGNVYFAPSRTAPGPMARSRQ
jgi:hypothetical protein